MVIDARQDRCRSLLTLLLLLVLAVAFFGPPSPANAETNQLGTTRVPAVSERNPRIIVGLEEPGEALPGEVDLQELGIRQLMVIPQLRAIVCEVLLPPQDMPLSGLQESTSTASERVEIAMTALEQVAGVEYVERETWREPAADIKPNDEWYRFQWNLGRVGLPAAWGVTTGSSAVTIAIIDTGLFWYDGPSGPKLLPDFEGRIVDPVGIWPEDQKTANYSPEPEAWFDDVGHGTACAGIAAATGNNDWLMAGVAWGTKIMPVKISGADYGISDVAEGMGIVWAVDHGADVINLSFGGSEAGEFEQSALDYAIESGVVVAAATGNDAQQRSGIFYPAAYPGVIAVGASDQNDDRTVFSQFGPEISIVAPGTGYPVYWVKDGNAFDLLQDTSSEGTSWSSPMVAGTAALMLSVNSSLTPQKIKDILEETAIDLGPPGWDPETGWGRLDAGGAVAVAAGRKPRDTGTKPVEAYLEVTSPSGGERWAVGSDQEIAWDSDNVAQVDIYLTRDGGETFETLISDFDNEGGAIWTVSGPASDDCLLVVADVGSYTEEDGYQVIAVSDWFSVTQGTGSSKFPDVAGHPYETAIGALSNAGIIDGFQDGTFRPNAMVARQQFAKMIVLTLDFPVSESDICTFRDVDSSGPSKLYPDNYVAVCADYGITMGTAPGLFSPWANISRAQLFTMVARSVALPDPPGSYVPPFGNFSGTHYPWARKAAYYHLLDDLEGMSAQYDFWQSATRGEVAQVLYNLAAAGD